MRQRIALITGANRGLGFEIARQLAQRGVHVVLTARSAEKGQAAAEQLRAAGLDVSFQQLDVTQPESIRSAVDAICAQFNRLDILINNAAVLLGHTTPGLQFPVMLIRELMEVNAYGPLLLCQAVIPVMQQQNYGRIVNISSRAGQLSSMGGGSLGYRMSKAALNVITRVLAAEVRDYNILINSMTPGHIRTDMGGPQAPRSPEQGADTAVWLALLPDGGPSGQFFFEREPIAW
ncbi:MAG: SDR family oxidoreductase [Anaerolineae bacterium]|nr:SDR family oxidoreductase [Anaerolineae bacterium]MDW8070210.1 SDR family oxidoreductase [Anaerolineae bacterium]